MDKRANMKRQRATIPLGSVFLQCCCCLSRAGLQPRNDRRHPFVICCSRGAISCHYQNCSAAGNCRHFHTRLSVSPLSAATSLSILLEGLFMIYAMDLFLGSSGMSLLLTKLLLMQSSSVDMNRCPSLQAPRS